MAKLKGPLLGISATGKLGDSLVFSKWKSRNVVKIKTDPENPQTEAQKFHRFYYGKCVGCYREAAFNDRDLAMWRLYKKDKKIKGSEYNAFLKFCLDFNHEQQPFPNLREMTIAKLMGTQVFIRCKWNRNFAPKIKKFNKYRILVASAYLYADGDYWSRTLDWCIPGETYYFCGYLPNQDNTWYYKWVHPID